MLRVLVVLPFYGGSLPVGRYCVEALKETGCLVEVFESPDFFPAKQALDHLKIRGHRFNTLVDNFVNFVAQCVVEKAEAFAPDLVLCMAQAPLSPLALKRLKAKGIPTAMWFVEDHRLFTYWQFLAPAYDIFAVIQKEPFFSKLEEIGVPNVLYLPMAAQPSVHRPLDLNPMEQREFGAPVSFFGAGYPNRRKAFAMLNMPGMKLWGTEWGNNPTLLSMLQRNGERISPEDGARIFNATTVNINLHSNAQPEPLVSGGDFVNPRTFELAASGAFQLVDRRSLLPELFNEDETATFGDINELREKTAYYLEREDERKAVTERARKRVLAEHTYARRMQTLLDFAAERIPGFGERKEPDWIAAMPDGMRESIAELAQALALPEHAGFEDIVAAVRAKQGRLSDAETALLFLDEWKKMYQ